MIKNAVGIQANIGQKVEMSKEKQIPAIHFSTVKHD